MASGMVRNALATAVLLLGGLSASVHGQGWHKSQGKMVSGDASKKTFSLETFNSGLCQSQENPTLVIYPDGHQVFVAQVRSTGAKDAYQAYVRYFNLAGSFLTEVKWWQYSMEKPNLWYNWKVEAKPDADLAAKFKDVRKVVFNYRC